MAINLNRVTSEQIVELASDLNKKGRFQVVLELLPTLDSWQLEELLAAVEQTLADVLLDEEEALEEQAKFEYKEISNNFYAYIRQWGRTQYNTYIGPMRFMQGIKYKLTHKSQGTVKTLAGLGLVRDGEQIYLKIQHLTPVCEVKSYLYYDKSLRFPRRPQEDVIEPLFSKKEWKIEYLGPIEDSEESKEKPVPVLQSTPEAALRPEKFVIPELATPPSAKDQNKPQKNTSLPIRGQKPTRLEASQTRKPQPVVQVKRNFISQVRTYLEQWEALSQAIPSNPQWKLTPHTGGLVLRNQTGEVIVEYNSTSKTLTTQSAHALLTWLQEIMFASANSKLVGRQQQSIASRWLPRLQCAPLEDSNKLLAYLFNL